MIRVTRKPAGFTLVEVLVAVAIISVALLSALRAAGQGTQNLDALRARMLAGWVAENRLAEHRALAAWLPVGVRQGTASEGGQEFRWSEEVVATPNLQFRRVDIRIYVPEDESHSLAHLVGFIVDAPRTGR